MNPKCKINSKKNISKMKKKIFVYVREIKPRLTSAR